ncbi:MAG: acetate kinase [Spirochaetales bacterium]|uniref:Acetate kinase n=1 Tax=Candidatus Thalassospirochaeta sargassi TaxID=3119039 RepID=A0AAJ1IDR0_9SPIO|nr:acetate kinase [Spirochaetales bacterium]
MEKLLVINCGSSSLKYEVYAMPNKTSLGKGLVERIGSPTGIITQKSDKGVIELNEPLPDHDAAMVLVKKALTDPDKGILKAIDEISGVGHRTVHGGEDYSTSVIIDEDVIEAIKRNTDLAPLHNPANLTGIKAAMEMLPGVPQVAVFDTAFHQTLAPSSYLYGLPRELYTKHKIRRYGFHGTSHRYVSKEAVKLMKRDVENTNVISCHLGNGASITAIRQGKSVETSMGFTPLEGLVMGTRSGDLDPAILLFLLEKGYSAEDINKMINKEGGLLGLSGVSNDMRDIHLAADKGNQDAIEALEVFAHKIRQYIGAYSANMVKVDALIFTGGIGENDIRMREMICHRLENIGIVMDYDRNKANGSKPGIVSKDYSPVTIIVMPTNEELQIATDTYELINEKYKSWVLLKE